MNQAILQPNHVIRLKTVAPSVPYLAVIIGMYLLNNGWASILLYHAGIVLILSLTGSWQVGRRLQRQRDYAVLALVVAGSILGGLFILLLWPNMKLTQLVLATYLANLGLQDMPWLLFMVYYFTINPLLEEIFWRGYLGHPSTKPVWSDVWFAGYHTLVLFMFVKIPWILVSFGLLLAVAWLWRQLARTYHGLMMPIISHAAADASIIGAVYLLLLQAI